MQLELDDLSEILNRINTWITNCDTKVSIILSAYGVLAGILLAMDYVSKFVTIFRVIFNNLSLGSAILIFLGVLITLFVLFRGLFYLIKSLFAKNEVEEFSSRGVKNDSVIFFSTIAKNKSLSEYRTKLIQYSSDEMVDDFISQIYICSLICDKKFSNYQKGLMNLLFGTISLIVLLFFLVIQTYW